MIDRKHMLDWQAAESKKNREASARNLKWAIVGVITVVFGILASSIATAWAAYIGGRTMAKAKAKNPATRAVMTVVGEFEADLRKKRPSPTPPDFMVEADPAGGDPVRRFYKDNGYNLGDLKG